MNHITYVNIHIHVCLTECMFYTHLLYHSSICNTHSFHLCNCKSIYLPVGLRSCFTATILNVCCTPLSKTIVKTPRLLETTKVARGTTSSCWQRRCFHIVKRLQYHVYLNHYTYVNIHIHVYHCDFMLYTHLSYRVHAFHLFIIWHYHT